LRNRAQFHDVFISYALIVNNTKLWDSKSGTVQFFEKLEIVAFVEFEGTPEWGKKVEGA